MLAIVDHLLHGIGHDDDINLEVMSVLLKTPQHRHRLLDEMEQASLSHKNSIAFRKLCFSLDFLEPNVLHQIARRYENDDATRYS